MLFRSSAAADELWSFWVNCKGLCDSFEREERFLLIFPSWDTVEGNGCPVGEVIGLFSREDTGDAVFLGCDIRGVSCGLSWDFGRFGTDGSNIGGGTSSIRDCSR